MKIYYLSLFIVFTFILISACSYIINYELVDNKNITLFKLVGNHPLHNFEDSTIYYSVLIISDSSEKSEYISYESIFQINAILECKDKIFKGKVTPLRINYLLEFEKLPFSILPYEDKHIIEITLLTKDSVEHSLKYQSKWNFNI